MNKNKSINLFKLGILFFGISLLLWNCEKEENQLVQENTVSEQLQKIFNQNDFSNLIPYEFTVDFSSPVKSYSEDLELFYYELPVNYTSLLNPQ
ncbi:hypothetical protein [Polaribacter sp. NJDZ03]|uniref:hypothetical protein n=1 Tax=Polaribacter sp. NJDZ03 TaxID=2855841 RepID=UPI001C4A36C1|nr:hypothetical protein [Polaribacter sp. NJDZ03]